MRDGAVSERMTLDLTPQDVALISAALRQYEPYWAPDDPDAPARLRRMVEDIARLLTQLAPPEPPRRDPAVVPMSEWLNRPHRRPPRR